MTRKKFSLQIEEPCSQNWDGMFPKDNGRFCSHCTKVVQDFTKMTEKQIIEFFKNYSGEVCGRFSNQQLEKTYIFNLRQTPVYFNRFLQFAISGLLTLKLTDSTSLDKDIKTKQISFKVEERNKEPLLIKEKVEKVIEGKVFNQNGQAGLVYTIVKITETGQSIRTDSTGKFIFELPNDFKGRQVTITFTHSGFGSQGHIISVAELPIRNLKIHMYYQNIKMGKIKYMRE